MRGLLIALALHMPLTASAESRLPFQLGKLPVNTDDWNTALGVRQVFSEHADLTFEAGFGDRDHTLFNFTYQF